MRISQNNTMNLISDTQSSSDRGASTVVQFILIFGFLAVLLGSVAFIVPNIITAQTDAIQQSELELVGTSISSEIQSFDRHIQQTNANSKTTTIYLPDRVGQERFNIEITETNSTNVYLLTASNQQESISYQTTMYVESELDIDSVRGEEVTLNYNGTHITQQNT